MDYSVTRILAELKLLDSKIDKKIANLDLVSTISNRDKKIFQTQQTQDEFTKKAKSSYESIDSTISNRIKIKSELIKSNSKTIVKINSKEYTVAEAIDLKSVYEKKKSLLSVIKGQLVNAKNQFISTEVDLKQRIDKMLLQNLGAQSTNETPDYDSLVKTFMDKNNISIFDPLNMKEKAEKMEEEIDNFYSEIDFVLSESNAKTVIDIDL